MLVKRPFDATNSKDMEPFVRIAKALLLQFQALYLCCFIPGFRCIWRAGGLRDGENLWVRTHSKERGKS